ncbi:Intradiol ring-cleavage dioxygenase [Bisporella sp. PMI_857]|nr:Intradiol ring-cleavage dioxygenase [Bisporella sp. PMI_857]
MVHFLSSVTLAVSLMGAALAHPGHDINLEIMERAAYAAQPEYRNLDHCAAEIKARDHQLIQRRMAMVDELRAKRGIKVKRTVAEVLAKNHQSSKAVTPDSSYTAIFGSNNSCILQPETTEGPYYVTGELVRRDITDDSVGQAGVPLTFDVQIIDTTTCKPLPQVALEAWFCNSTGVYGGVVANGNGNSADRTNLDNTMLRGIQFSDASGILQFDSIFPGHYTGRTPHIHILSHIGSTTLTNGTITTGKISHVGQLFFDQSLITRVEATSPYNTNRQSLTTNQNDGIFAQEAATSDPVLNYVLLGSAITDGIFGWATVGINPTISKTVNAAAHYDGPN